MAEEEGQPVMKMHAPLFEWAPGVTIDDNEEAPFPVQEEHEPTAEDDDEYVDEPTNHPGEEPDNTEDAGAPTVNNEMANDEDGGEADIQAEQEEEENENEEGIGDDGDAVDDDPIFQEPDDDNFGFEKTEGDATDAEENDGGTES